MSSQEVYPINSTLPLAYTDELTQLPNRAWLNKQLTELVNTHPGSFAVVFIDIDGLKSTNDQYGHAAGDKLLQKAAVTLSQSVRTEETPEARPKDEIGSVARQSGDEFIAVLKDITHGPQVDLIIERVRTKLQSEGMAASMGGRMHRIGESGSDLLKAADLLMYQDKQARKRLLRESLPRRKRLAAWAGEKLVNYAGQQIFR